MKTLNLTQGSPDWHQHRATHHNASDAPAMMGCSPYKTRTQLLDELSGKAPAEIDAGTQKRFDDGHRFEGLARPLAEKILGEELFPCVGEDGKLSASFDGLTLMYDVAWEHKSLNDALRDAIHPDCKGYELPLHYQVQMEQQAMVSGADRVLFMASKWNGEELIEERHCWYAPNSTLRTQIVTGWAQLERDLIEHRPAVAKVEAVGRAPDSLPALHIELTGIVTASNLAEYRDTAIAVFKGISTDLQTDQDFADADKAVKWCGDIEDRLKAAKDHALSQTQSIDELFRAIDSISAEARAKRLELEKLVKSRKESIRTEIAYAGRDTVSAHYATINATLGEHSLAMPATIGADLNAAIKGKRTVSSIRDAIDTTVAQAKITASQKADQVRACIAVLSDHAKGYESLFEDRVQLCSAKAPEDLRNLVATRIADYVKREADRVEAEREKIRAEEVAKLASEAAAKADRERADAERVAREADAVTRKAAQESALSAAHAPSPASAAIAPVTTRRRTPSIGEIISEPARPDEREITLLVSRHYNVSDSIALAWLRASNFNGVEAAA